MCIHWEGLKTLLMSNTNLHFNLIVIIIIIIINDYKTDIIR